MNSMIFVIPLNLITCKKDSKRRCETTTPESIHTKDESKRDCAFTFIFGVNWPVQWMWRNDNFHGIHDIQPNDPKIWDPYSLIYTLLHVNWLSCNH